MHALKRRPVAAGAVLEENRVLAVDPAGRCLLADGRLARCAASCLLVPEAGDRVTTVVLHDELFLLHVLERGCDGAARLHVGGARELRLEQEAVALHAAGNIALLAAGDVEVTAVEGNVALNARNLFVTAADAVVENARHRVAQVHHYLLQVRQLWQVHSRHGMLTAEGDLKVDADRVSVG